MNIAEAKEQVKDTVEAYLAKDSDGMYIIPAAHQRPIFLLGAPGIGKTAIMEQIAQELGIGLVSYSMTHHTRQSALGLPLITHHDFDGLAYDASEYTMSEIIASIYDYMETTGMRQGILFLDEINCVSETLYPSMLQFLQFKMFGRHKVPVDWVVVCAGNPPEYNKSVHEFDIVTLDRLRKVEIEPEYAAWKAFAQATGVHPAITTYLEVKKDDFYSVESKPGGKSFVTARGWSDLSEIITLFEDMGKKVNLQLISQFLQDQAISERFAVYYDLFNKYRSDYQVDKILAGTAGEEILARAKAAEFDERIALLGLLLDALEHEMGGVCDKETLLIQVRDVLREAKPHIIAGQSAQEVLGETISALEAELAKEKQTASVPTPQMRMKQRTANALKALCALEVMNGVSGGEESFAMLADAFQEKVAELDPAIDACEEKLAHAYDFVDAAFEDDREGLVFTVELTARRSSSQYINRFGSEAYFRHNEGVMVDRHTQNLMDRIDAAGLTDDTGPVVPPVAHEENTDAVLEAAKGASRMQSVTPAITPAPAGNPMKPAIPVVEDAADHSAGGRAQSETAAGESPASTSERAIDPQQLADYYAQTKFEFGLPSLCKMTLPSDLEGKTVLDIGCRRGKGVFKLSDRVGADGRVIGVDWTPEYIKEAQAKTERAWKDNGLPRNNMEFCLAYPEDLSATGVEDNSVDLIYVNSITNLAFDMDAAFAEMKRVLKPGGIIVHETVLADAQRDPKVIAAAREIGNSVQAALDKRSYENLLVRTGFKTVTYHDSNPVQPEDGALEEHPVEVVESDEDVRFTAIVADITKGFLERGTEPAEAHAGDSSDEASGVTLNYSNMLIMAQNNGRH